MLFDTFRQFNRALRIYKKDRDVNKLLNMQWQGDFALFMKDIENRIHQRDNQWLQQKQAKYLALQNQINPHFLYNTLEAIRADAMIAGCEDIAETTEALATFFRYTISNVEESVTFSDELDNVENYFIVQQCRFGNRISLEVEMENEVLLEAKMPKLILQPVVENAIVHGLEGKLDGGVVKIIIENSEKTLFLRVRDNGVGICEEELIRLNRQLLKSEQAERSPGRHGIALMNVNTRIRLMCGEDYGLKIFSAEKIGTECCLTLPLLLGEEE